MMLSWCVLIGFQSIRHQLKAIRRNAMNSLSIHSENEKEERKRWSCVDWKHTSEILLNKIIGGNEACVKKDYKIVNEREVHTETSKPAHNVVLVCQHRLISLVVFHFRNRTQNHSYDEQFSVEIKRAKRKKKTSTGNKMTKLKTSNQHFSKHFMTN